ncbi:AAA family ATPase [Pseudomonas sp. BIGb0164]|nr:AAA family ATPase [Pseudomonas sp. BIGb0164]MCS4249464.1 energy-coupling factor transporter ATP-binding protein EcfA2 [Pseudomonas sp. BIGb0164]SDN54613.1 Predicted ATP-binding protein involved in virulence [Pseudomonas azotoformans]
MFLMQVSLRNVRSIKSLDLDFRSSEGNARRWTLLLGENGCGKSSALRAIALLLAGSEALPDLLGEPDAWIRNGSKKCLISGILATAKGEIREIALEINRGDGIRQIFSRNHSSLEALDKALSFAERNYFVLGYGVSRRPAAPKSRSTFPDERSRVPRSMGVATMFSPDATLISLEQWAMDLEYRKGSSSMDAIRRALNQLLPDMQFSRIDRESRQIIFDTVDGEIPLSQLSDGYQNIAAWCGDLLYRITEAFPDRKDPLSTRGVLLIDEIDLHLHPTWRRKLVEFLSLTLPNFQFVATTHSALTAQQSGDGELYVIRREGKDHLPTLTPFVGEPRNMMLHQLLMSPMFGLRTMDSVAVENARSVVRTLSSKKTPLSVGESRELKHMYEVLSEAPNWDAIPEYAKEQIDLLKRINSTLDKDGKRPAVSARKLKSVVKEIGSSD